MAMTNIVRKMVTIATKGKYKNPRQGFSTAKRAKSTYKEYIWHCTFNNNLRTCGRSSVHVTSESYMEGFDNNAWVFDSLVGFLHGPIWNVPLQTFIEEKSLPFEPSDEGEVLDRPEYKKIHVEYRNLVDVMLGSFMDDIGITAEQFEAACQLSAGDLSGLPSYFHKRLFEQIWAANDYEMFVKMMTHKNVELQLQALELIEQRYGNMPSLYSMDEKDLDTSKSDDSFEFPDNDDVMTEIKKLQLDDFENCDKEMGVQREEMVVEKHTLLSKLHTVDIKEKDKLLKPTSIELKTDSQLKPAPQKVEVSEEEVRARQEYLKQQRDKLLALKKQVRERKLDAVENVEASGDGESSQRNVARPRSARVAHAVLKGAPPSAPSDAMQLRRALASKLKAEVVETSQ